MQQTTFLTRINYLPSMMHKTWLGAWA